MTPLLCTHCGAHVPPPADPNATFASCQHCQYSVPLSVEWVRLRQQQQAAIDQRQFQAKLQEQEVEARKAAARSASKERLVWALGIGGLFVVIGGIVLVTVGSELWDQAQQAEAMAEQRAREVAQGKERVAQLAGLLEKAKAAGCSREVSEPTAFTGRQSSTLTMATGGNCLRTLATGPGPIALELQSPSGKVAKGAGQGTLDFEHCPAESGQHEFRLNGSDGDVLAYAMVDCPPAFDKHKDDPKKNGLARARARLVRLEEEGCKRVILPPKPITGERSLTAKMEPGAYCTVLVAAAGSDDNPLSVTMKSPMGEAVAAPKAAGEIELAHCATVVGDHAVQVTPKTLDYYTLAAMDCPRSVARKRGAK